jgi:hypothetical protein
MAERLIMPDGTPFAFWDDETEYSQTYHVARGHPSASDDGPGTEERPFLTIGRAAAVLQPGQKVVVHEGVYRECIRPARGGEGPDRMIAYQAAPGERVVVKGSEQWHPDPRPSEGWSLRGGEPEGPVWMADLPADWFVGYNPFLCPNMPAEYRTFVHDWSPEDAHRFQLRRGMIFADGRPLEQVFRFRELGSTDGAFWVEDDGLRIHFRLPADAEPGEAALEVSTRAQVFAPAVPGLGYVRVSGFEFAQAADPVPIPQRALVSTSRGNHWIIEDNEIHCANACGMDIGRQSWHAARLPIGGRHVVRRNHVHDCGVSALQGCGGVDGSLIEDNLFERIGGRVPERLFECAGLKFHTTTGALIRRNVFRHIRNACGLWLDVRNFNCRVTGNVFADIESFHAAVHVECSHELNAVDGNVIWDVRSARAHEGPPGSTSTGGIGVFGDSCDNLVLAHNLFGRLPHNYAVSFHLNQPERLIGGRVGLGRRHKALNNVFCECPKRILFGRAIEVDSDGNLFDARDDAASLCVRFPEPAATLNLTAWQDYYGLDARSVQAAVEVEFDPETLEMSWRTEGKMPDCRPVECLHADEPPAVPGPFTREEWDAGRKRVAAGPPNAPPGSPG